MSARSVVVVVLLLAAARAQAQPAPLSLLDVPYVSQSEALCGGAAAAMVLRYWGERGVSADTFAPLVDRSAAGIRTTALVSDLARRGWRVTVVQGTRAFVDGELANGRPVITLIEDRPRVYHYVVIVGATERAVIFHDPARAPLRVMTRDEFDRRSRAANQWMAVVLPGAHEETPAVPVLSSPSSAASSCDERISLAVDQAQRNDLDAAERTLTAALSCPGPAAPRELAGVRLLQRRWDDVAQLSSAALAQDPADGYAWRLLATSRFVLNHPLDALDAWNHVAEPRLDLVRVEGLEHTRQRPVEQLLGLFSGDLITSSRFVQAERALHELPSARSSRLELRPVPQGLAELHATIVERGRIPSDRWSWAAISARSAITRTAAVTLGSLFGAGESMALEWRFWPNRPRIAASVRAPAPWPGTWGVDLFGESQAFDDQQPSLRRRGGRLNASRWVAPGARLELRGGAERWNSVGTVGTFGLTGGFASRTERLSARVNADGWAGASRFASLSLSATATSARRTITGSVAPLGRELTATTGVAVVTSAAPLDLWPAGDTGQARPVLARAHPVLDDGRLQVARLGQRVAFASAEVQHWWSAPALSRIAAIAFVDSVRTMARSGGAAPLQDVDVGAAIGLASVVVPGRVYLSYAHGLRDGADVFSARYVVAAW